MPPLSPPETTAPSATLIPLAAEHAADAAQLHIAGQPGTFLTRLGPDVLATVYRALPQSSVGFGFAAVDGAECGVQSAEFSDSTERQDNSSQQPAASSQQPVVGFISATTSVGRLFLEMGTCRAAELLPGLLTRFLQQPGLALQSMQTVLYPFLSGATDAGNAEDGNVEDGEADGVAVELLSIMVDPAQRGRGIGTQLLRALIAACRQRDITVIDVTVDAANTGARRFYVRHGFVLRREFALYGRDMCSYRLQLAHAVAASTGVQVGIATDPQTERDDRA